MRTCTQLEPGNRAVSSKKLVTRRRFCALAVPVAGFGSERREGVALLWRVADGKLVTSERGQGSGLRKEFPGSVLKPLVVSALIERKVLRPDETFLCPGFLTVRGRQLNCVHPRLALPMDPARAIAYSCNCAVAHWAARVAVGELTQALELLGLPVRETVSDVRLLALGEAGVRVSAAELLGAYRRVVLGDVVRQGMEGAVEFGTAQRAALPHVRVAGKTGSGGGAAGGRVAWFAGFAPSHEPEIFVVVLAAGGSGGSDAAPWAHEEMAHYFGARA